MSASSSERMEQWLRRPRLVAVVILVLWACAAGLRIKGERAYAFSDVEDQPLYVRSGEVLGRMALSFDALLADVYWIRALQHYGGTKRAGDVAKSYDLLYPFLDITTTLDPRFNIAYRFGAIFLTEAYPNGPGRPDQALALLQKGWQQMPERWEYLMDIGFVYYWWLSDYDEAARWFQRASEVPGASWWVRTLAANTLTEGGNRRDARFMWGQILKSSADPWLRNEAARRLLQLDALDDLDRYTKEAERFETREGRWPASWRELIQRGPLDLPPLDPLGHTYLLESSARTITLSPQSPLHPLPAASLWSLP